MAWFVNEIFIHQNKNLAAKKEEYMHLTNLSMALAICTMCRQCIIIIIIIIIITVDLYSVFL